MEEAGWASILSFIGGGLISLLATLTLSELLAATPRTGGGYHYVNYSFGGFFGRIVGWGMWIGLMFASAFYMIGFGQYLTYFLVIFETIASDLPKNLISSSPFKTPNSNLQAFT